MRIGRPKPATPDAVSRAKTAFETEALASVDSLYRTALRLTRVPADAEDLVQDTYLKAFRAADTFEPGTNLRAWLFTILHNTARNRARDRARDHVPPKLRFAQHLDVVAHCLPERDPAGHADIDQPLLHLLERRPVQQLMIQRPQLRRIEMRWRVSRLHRSCELARIMTIMTIMTRIGCVG